MGIITAWSDDVRSVFGVYGFDPLIEILPPQDEAIAVAIDRLSQIRRQSPFLGPSNEGAQNPGFASRPIDSWCGVDGGRRGDSAPRGAGN